MKIKSPKKRYISIILTAVFLVVSITGILMFFMIESHAMNKAHAWLGIAFVAIGIYHLIKNFTPFKNYLKYKSSFAILILILLLSTWYINPKSEELTSPKKEIMKAVFMQPLLTVSKFFKKDVYETINYLETKGIKVKSENQSLMQIAQENKKEVKEVFFIFFEK